MRATATVVRLEHLPEAMRSLHALSRLDYVDSSTLQTSDAASWSAEQWARAVLEDGPLVRRYGFIPWRVVLGLRLGPSHAPGYVHGWKIVGRGEDWIRLEAASWLMTCNAVARVEEGRVTVALFVRYDNRVAATVWSLASTFHRRALPVILYQGFRVLSPAPMAEVAQ